MSANQKRKAEEKRVKQEAEEKARKEEAERKRIEQEKIDKEEIDYKTGEPNEEGSNNFLRVNLEKSSFEDDLKTNLEHISKDMTLDEKVSENIYRKNRDMDISMSPDIIITGINKKKILYFLL